MLAAEGAARGCELWLISSCPSQPGRIETCWSGNGRMASGLGKDECHRSDGRAEHPSLLTDYPGILIEIDAKSLVKNFRSSDNLMANGA